MGITTVNNSNKNTKNKEGWINPNNKTIPLHDLKANASINLDQFDSLIRRNGVRVLVYRSMFCPNIKSIDGAEHDINCQIPGCNGSGYIDIVPLETFAFFQSQTFDKENDPAGSFDGNVVSATFLSGIELQYFTKIELIDFQEIYFQRCRRNDTNLNVLKYKAYKINAIVDAQGFQYYQDIDFTLDSNGSILWNTGKGPLEDVIFSIHYHAAIQFRAIKGMHNNRFIQAVSKTGDMFFTKAPEQWLLQKEYLVKRVDENGNEIMPDPIL